MRVAAILVLLLFAAAPAAGRTVTVRWRWPNPEPGRTIAGFKLYTRHADEPYGPPLDVGLPPEQDGVYSYSLEVSDSDATYVSATAYDAQGVESARSNEKLFLLPEPEGAMCLRAGRLERLPRARYRVVPLRLGNESDELPPG